jgi:hypothetical protein
MIPLPYSITPVQLVRNALDILRVDHSGLSMLESHTEVGYPGGSYWNRQLVVTDSDGHVELFGLDVILAPNGSGPQIAANDIIRYFRLVPLKGVSGGCDRPAECDVEEIRRRK